MRKLMLIFVMALVMVMVFFTGFTIADEEEKTIDAYSSGETGEISQFQFEADDVLGSKDGDWWMAAKIQTSGGEGKDKEVNLLFANGEEAWVKPVYVSKTFRLIQQSELKVGQRVFYTTSNPDDWPNKSIRFASFQKGKITSIGKLHRNIVQVGTQELRWDKQILIY